MEGDDGRVTGGKTAKWVTAVGVHVPASVKALAIFDEGQQRFNICWRGQFQQHLWTMNFSQP